MFTSPRYATRGVTTTVPLMLQIILWDLIDSMDVAEKDYLQVFKLTATDKTQHVTHTQEQPPYERTLEFRTDNPITAKIFVIDDETIYLSDQFFNKTLANIKENAKVAVVFWEGNNAFQIHGTATYVNEGEQFEALAAKVNAAFEAMGMPIRAKGGVFVHVDSVYSSAPGPQAGAQIA